MALKPTVVEEPAVASLLTAVVAADPLLTKEAAVVPLTRC